jgi:hypothetical protein
LSARVERRVFLLTTPWLEQLQMFGNKVVQQQTLVLPTFAEMVETGSLRCCRWVAKVFTHLAALVAKPIGQMSNATETQMEQLQFSLLQMPLQRQAQVAQSTQPAEQVAEDI